MVYLAVKYESIDHVTCLHFVWPLEYQGDFPPGKSVCVCIQSLYLSTYISVTSRNVKFSDE